MFQHTRSRHNALFRHMTDDKDCHTQSFCELHQDAGALSYLADTARCGTRFPGAAVSEAAAAYRPAAVPDDAGADGASTIVFHALHAGHCPIHLEDS